MPMRSLIFLGLRLLRLLLTLLLDSLRFFVNLRSEVALSIVLRLVFSLLDLCRLLAGHRLLDFGQLLDILALDHLGQALELSR